MERNDRGNFLLPTDQYKAEMTVEEKDVWSEQEMN
jgi:hypothetical protein